MSLAAERAPLWGARVEARAAAGVGSHAHARCLRWLLAPAFVASLALALRVGPTVWHDGAWLALGRYDDGVYFGSAIALMHGQLPYRDALLLHPPGITVLLAPFAVLAGPLGDAAAFTIAKAVFMALGAATALGVAGLVRQRGTAAMLLAGGTYALFWPAAYAESSISLEAASNALLVGALLLLKRNAERWALVAGALLGFAAGVKIWGAVPLLVIAGFVAWRHGKRPAARLLAGAAGSLIVVCGPFFVAAPATMWRQVVLDQLNRQRGTSSIIERLPAIFGIPAINGHGGPRTVAATWLVFAIIAVVVVLLLVRTARRGEVLAAALFVASLGVLIASPSNFLQYGAMAAVPLAWCVGASLDRRLLQAGWAAAGTASLLLVMAFNPGTVLSQRFLNAVAAVPGCIASDDPGALIASNTLSRNLKAGCVTWIDVTGVTYDAVAVRSSNGFSQPRRQDADWNELLNPYLESGAGVIHGRPSTGIHPDAVHYWRIAAQETVRDGGYTLNVWNRPGDPRPPTWRQWSENFIGPIPWPYGQ